MARGRFYTAPVNPSYWFTEAGLYHKENYTFQDEDGDPFLHEAHLKNVLDPSFTIDIYCPNCEKETIFRPLGYRESSSTRSSKSITFGLHYVHFKCSRHECGSDLLYIFLLIRDGSLTKIGQYPSIADLLKPQVNKYKPVLNSDLLHVWQKAIGLHAHGVGAGSFVYLRRIIESLVIDARDKAIENQEIDEDTFNRSSWPERINMLSSYLPKFLVDKREVYGILSKGVHELTEEKCKEYFDVMHNAIEIICDEKLEELEKSRKIAEGSKAIQKVKKDLSSDKS